MSNKVYDFLAIIGRLILPAIATLYFTLSQIWHLPLGEEICGTLAALTVFLNSVLKIKSDEYWKEIDEGSNDGED
jgi:hypothetical protein